MRRVASPRRFSRLAPGARMNRKGRCPIPLRRKATALNRRSWPPVVYWLGRPPYQREKRDRYPSGGPVFNRVRRLLKQPPDPWNNTQGLGP